MVCGEYGCPSFAQLLRFLHTLYTVHQCFPLETLPRLDYLGRHLARLFKPRMGGGRSRSQDDIRSGAGSPERCHRLRGSHLCEPGGHLKGSGAIHPKSVRVLCAFLCEPTRWRLIATHLPRPHGNSAHRASRSRLGLMTALAAGNGGPAFTTPGSHEVPLLHFVGWFSRASECDPRVAGSPVALRFFGEIRISSQKRGALEHHSVSHALCAPRQGRSRVLRSGL